MVKRRKTFDLMAARCEKPSSDHTERGGKGIELRRAAKKKFAQKSPRGSDLSHHERKEGQRAFI